MSAAAAATSGRDIVELIDFSADSLHRMRLPSGLYCYERVQGEEAPGGRSLRYTLMTLLGLQKATQHGFAHGHDLAATVAALWDEIDSPELDPGDYGLYLWAETRLGGDRGDELAGRLEASLASAGGLSARLGMELGWIVTGLAHHVASGGSPAGERLLGQALEQLLGPNRAPSGLFRHHGDPGLRRRFPNFATQIYSVLALATIGGLGLDERALGAARAAADRLLALQLADGGWPWLYDAERGTVVERYEIYSVHQDAMAPMGMFELADALGDERYARAAVHGLGWIYGRNELGHDMVDRENGLVLRSIRRRRGPDRLWLAAKTGASLAGLPTRGSTARLTELNPTDRPYHFGWVLEAWCGREHVADSASG